MPVLVVGVPRALVINNEVLVIGVLLTVGVPIRASGLFKYPAPDITAHGREDIGGKSTWATAGGFLQRDGGYRTGKNGLK